MRAVMTKIAVAVVLVAAGACSKDHDKAKPNQPSQLPSQSQAQPSPAATPSEPERQAPPSSMQDQQSMPGEQTSIASGEPATMLDSSVEEAIRREITGQTDLSTEAKSVQ